MDILFILAVGLVAGFLADLVVKNKYGLLADLIIGLAGSLIGYLILDQFGISVHQDSFIGLVISAFIGAVLLLIVLNLFTREKKNK